MESDPQLGNDNIVSRLLDVSKKMLITNAGNKFNYKYKQTTAGWYRRRLIL